LRLYAFKAPRNTYLELSGAVELIILFTFFKDFFVISKISITFADCLVSQSCMDKKQMLLDAALKLFVEYGFHGTPTSLIAKEAGVANGTLFHYFKTKDELIVALYVDIKSKMTSHVFGNEQGQATFKETVKEQYVASLYWALDNQLQFRFVEQFKNSPYLAHIAPGEIEASLKPFHDMLYKGIKEKILKPHPAELIFTLISSHTYGINQYLIAGNFPKAKQHQVISESFEMLWAMIT